VALFLFLFGVAYPAWIRTPSAIALVDTPPATNRTLTLAERVAYQYAIEEIYWRHRIWPKDNPGPKPALDAVISQQQIERKVRDYLRKSQQVANQRGAPITVGELQAEIERVTSHTREPNVLRELFEVLGNDPFVIAECLARPNLARRMASEPAKHVSGRVLLSGASPSQVYRLPEILDDCTDNSWTATSGANVPDIREYDTAIWTGSEMILWGGANSNGGHVNTLDTGATYDPVTDTWAATNTLDAPLGRDLHTAVWTGIEMIIWGGYNYPALDLNTGGRYNPTTGTWLNMSTANAPVARRQHSAVWTGTEMIVWGGRDGSTWYNSGGRYNPSTDSWVATSTLAAPERRWYHTAEWTGSEMIVWGGTNQTIPLNTGGKYNPTTDSWTPTSSANVPIGRYAHTSIWSGSDMIVWGGVDSTLYDSNTGGRYNPTSDSWTTISTLNAPSPRAVHSAVWTGNEMIVWGGVCCNPSIDFNTGGRYNPSTDSWTATTTVNVPQARDTHTAVWTGDKMIIWGGGSWASNNYIFLNTGGTYCAQPSTQLQSVVSRKTHSFVGDFDLNLPLSGTPAIECRSGGATNDYAIVLTFNANITVNGNPQAAVTAGIATIGSGGVGNGGRALITGNIVTIPLTNVANAQTINVTLYGVNGSTNIMIPMSILIGDTNGNGRVNASDVSQTKSRVGQQIDVTNFRSDVNANGYIDAVDVALMKASVGTGLPH
jgi:N-acetylneuraminic acid mutarotase